MAVARMEAAVRVRRRVRRELPRLAAADAYQPEIVAAAIGSEIARAEAEQDLLTRRIDLRIRDPLHGDEIVHRERVRLGGVRGGAAGGDGCNGCEQAEGEVRRDALHETSSGDRSNGSPAPDRIATRRRHGRVPSAAAAADAAVATLRPPVTLRELIPRATTVIAASRLSARLGVEVTIVSEAFQETGSFKFRAAANVVASSPHESFVTLSSGNFGQALARAAQLAGRRALVAMPALSSPVKVEAVRGYGAELDLYDSRQVGRIEKLRRLGEAHPEAYLASPYDDALVIAGNASLGHEIAALGRRFDAVVVPVGGGGLASGVATGLAAAGFATELWGAEPLAANDAARSLRSGRIERNEGPGEPATIADGARTPALGDRNWEILRTALTGIVEVPEEEIRAAVRLLFSAANLKAEPTGALALGALLAQPDRFRSRSVAIVVSGGNVDPDLYRELLA